MDTRISVHDRRTYPELDAFRGKVSEDEIQAIYEQEQMCFWDVAQALAQEHGFDGVYQEGRSGGWAEPYPQPEDGAGEKIGAERYQALADDLAAEMDYRRSEFLRRVEAVSEVIGFREVARGCR